MPTINDIASLAKRRGFIFPGSSIYGGLANTWDYGPLGVELKRNIESLWWETFITGRDDMVGLDSSIILNPKVWQASGHLSGFADAMVDCKTCKNRTRADHLIEDFFAKQGKEIKVEGKSLQELTQIIQDNQIKCPVCGGKDLTEVRSFNLLFPTKMGILQDDSDTVYLRGETAQGIFINFKNVLDSTRVRLPFGVGQIGKSFRNEITKGKLTFRLVEFTQAEIEYFFNPENQNWQELFETWLAQMQAFVTQTLGVDASNLRVREHTDEERSFYSTKTVDLEYRFPFGFKELWGLAYRTDYDLSQHQKYSGKDLSYTDPHTGRKFIPHVIEPAGGIDRFVLMVLFESYWQDKAHNRLVLKLPSQLVPTQVAVFPLLRNHPDLVKVARQAYQQLKSKFKVAWDDRGNIGKRYFYQDEMGTPFCVTIDHQTLADQTVTVRHRDTTKQDRVALDKLLNYLANKF